MSFQKSKLKENNAKNLLKYKKLSFYLFDMLVLNFFGYKMTRT